MAILGRAKHIPQQTTRMMVFRKLGLAWTEYGLQVVVFHDAKKSDVKFKFKLSSLAIKMVETIYWGTSHVVFFSSLRRGRTWHRFNRRHTHMVTKTKDAWIAFSWHLSQSVDLVLSC